MLKLPWKYSLESWRNFFLFFLVLFIPLKLIGTEFAIGWLYIITIALLIKKKESLRKSIIQYGMLIYIIGVLVSALFAANPSEGLIYLRKLWRFGLPSVVYFAFRKQNLQPYLKLLIFMSVGVCAYGIIQYFTGIDFLRTGNFKQSLDTIDHSWHAIGAFSHHLTFGGVFLVICPVVYAPVFSSAFRGRERLLLAVAAVIIGLAVFLSFGRSSMLGILTGLFLVFFFIRPKLMSLFAVVLVAALIVSFSQRDYLSKVARSTKNPLATRVTSILFFENQSDRLNMWIAGIRIIKDYPVFGIGGYNAETMLPYYQAVEKERKEKFQHHPGVGVHNIYLQTWINFGILGILGYLIMWFNLIRRSAWTVLKDSHSREKNRSFLIGIVAGLCGSMVAGLAENNFRDGEVQIAIFFMMGCAMALIDQWRISQQDQKSP